MKKIIAVLLISFSLLTSCFAFEPSCEHVWKDATCTQPKTCSKCGETQGSALGHDFRVDSVVNPTCTTNGSEITKCTRCGLTNTKTLVASGHDWKNATCTQPKTCSECGETIGEPLGHIGDDFCTRCGAALLPYYKAGMYIVGTDIAAGEYFVKTLKSTCYVERASSADGTLDSIIANENIRNFGYITLNSGEYFTIKNGVFIEIDKAPTIQPDNDTYSSGMYKVGRDIQEGEYYVYTKSNTAYFEVASASSHELNDVVCIDSNITFSYITVKNGEYFTVRGEFIPAEKAPIPTPQNDTYSSGMYKVGRDIPAGEYYVYAKSNTAYFEVASASSHKLNDVICIDSNITSSYITVKNGEYFTVRGEFVPAEKAPIPTPQNDTLSDGMYKVGRDIPAGEYKLCNSSDRHAYVEVAKNSRHILESIVFIDSFDGQKYINVVDGQYVTISNCYINVKSTTQI